MYIPLQTHALSLIVGDFLLVQRYCVKTKALLTSQMVKVTFFIRICLVFVAENEAPLFKEKKKKYGRSRILETIKFR